MLAYLEKFNKLPQDLRQKVTTEEVMRVVEDLEKKYGINLATIIMRVMIKDINLTDLVKYFVFEFHLNETKAEELVNELKEKVFIQVADYLSFIPTQKPQITDFPSLNKEGVWGADHFFSQEEEEEVRKLTKKLDEGTEEVEEVLADNKIEERLDKILAQVKINFGSEDLAARFRRILKIHLRGIRDGIDTKQTLIKPIKDGGLGFDQESADQVLKIVGGEIKDISKPRIFLQGIRPSREYFKKVRGKLDKISVVALPVSQPQKIKAPEKEKKPSSIEAGARDIDYDLASLKSKDVKKGEEIFDKLDTEHEPASPLSLDSARLAKRGEIAPPPPAPIIEPKEKKMPEKPVAELPRQEPVKEEKEISTEIEEKEAPVQEVKQIDARQIHQASGKIKMEDVKFNRRHPLRSGAGFTPKVMGPIDELGYMDLISFRRLDADLAKVGESIKEKIELLEEEGYAKRLEGIKAWRNSPINKLYLKIGQASINENKPIETIIDERNSAGKDYLNTREFEVVTDLNRDLRF